MTLAVRDLVLSYGDAIALAGVSLEVGKGEAVALIGANGAGKSSLIRAIAGIECARSGQVEFGGRAITGFSTHQIWELGIAHVAEGRQLFGALSVEANLELGAMLRRARPRKQRSLERVYALFPRLAERRHQHAGTMSGGEQQMLAIGRALMACPELILFDEPSLGLSPVVVKEMFHAIATLHHDGVAVLVVEQNVAASLRISSRGYVLENGRIELSATSDVLLKDDRVRRAYLGA